MSIQMAFRTNFGDIFLVDVKDNQGMSLCGYSNGGGSLSLFKSSFCFMCHYLGHSGCIWPAENHSKIGNLGTYT